jgi:2-aminoethylphosphonate-pyruvate transaminase
MTPKDKLLFTPGPLTTSPTVKQAMLHDYGSRDFTFINAVKEIRSKLLGFAGVSKADGYDTVIMQGSGTFGVEAVMQTAIPKDGHLLIIINGAYGERIAKMLNILNIENSSLVYAEDEFPKLEEIETTLKNNTTITHVAVVHCETTSGIFNPIDEIGKIVKAHNKIYIVDAMSSFGAVPVNVKDCGIDYLVSSSNKCIEGVPGFSFAIVNTQHLSTCKGNSRSLSLDLFEQWKGLEANGQFRFTPPVHSLMAFHQAMQELEEEGSVEGRSLRYQSNFKLLMEGMVLLGFQPYLSKEKQGYIINTFHSPTHSHYHFETFYQKLNERGFVIYPGKLTKADCFRIGNIGRLYAEDIEGLLKAIEVVKNEMGF